ncbi:MAG: hypothetical protein WBO10_03100 [Pyrinomonadaceae bacterium]
MKFNVYQLSIVIGCIFSLGHIVSGQPWYNPETDKNVVVNGLITKNVQYGGYVCPTILDTAGRCGQPWVASSSYAAAYAKGVYDRLAALELILAAMKENTAASKSAQASMERMAIQMNDGIQQIVIKRFETLPAELFNDPLVKERLKKLQDDITKDIKDSLTKPPD